jgi:predicted nucleic acid-binding protein
MNYLKNLNKAEDFLVREASREIYTIDSSVIIKWFCNGDEDSIDIAKFIYKKAQSRNFYLLSPELLIYELLNILRYKTDISKMEVGRIIQRILETQIIVLLDSQIYLDAYEISREIEESIYDSIYIAVAKKFRAPLLTADQKLYKKAKSSGHNVILLKDFLSLY